MSVSDVSQIVEVTRYAILGREYFSREEARMAEIFEQLSNLIQADDARFVGPETRVKAVIRNSTEIQVLIQEYKLLEASRK